jgi:hypothetical protein
LPAVDGREHTDHLFGFPPAPGNGHLNPFGNEVAGNAIAAYLRVRLEPK